MKKFTRIVGWLAAVTLTLVVLGLIGLKLFLPVEKIRALAIEEGSEALGRPVTIEDLNISIWGGLGIELGNVSIANPDGFDGPALLTAEKVDLKLQLLGLIAGEARIDRLIIKSPDITMVRTSDGRTNFAFTPGDSASLPESAADLPPEGQAAAAAISFERLEVVGGRLLYQDDSSQMVVRLAGLELSTSLENRRPGRYESSGQIDIDTVEVTVDEVYPTVALGLNYTVEYDMDSDRVTVKSAKLRFNELMLELTGEVTQLSGAMEAKGSVKTDRLGVTDLLSLMPAGQLQKLEDYEIEGAFSLNADWEYVAAGEPALTYSGVATVSDVSLAADHLQGELKIGQCQVDFKPDNLRLNIEAASFAGQPIKGHLVVDGFDNPVIGGELAGKIDLALVEPFLPTEPPQKLSGQTDLDLKFSGPVADLAAFNFSGHLDILDGTYQSELIPEPITSFMLNAYFDNRLIRIDRLACSFASGNLVFDGRVTDLVPYLLADSLATVGLSPGVEGTLVGEVDLQMVKPYLPEKGSPQLTGRLELDVTVTGQLDDLATFRPQGSVAIKEASYSDSLLAEPIERFEATLKLRPDTIEVSRLAVQFVSSDVSFTGRLAHPFPYFLPLQDLDRGRIEKPFFVFELTSHRFDVDRLFPEAVPGLGESSSTISADSVSPVILPRIDGRGTVAIDTVIYAKVELADVKAKVRIHNRIIECYDATGRVYSGTVSGKTSIDLSDFDNPRYAGEFAANQVEADDFVSRFTKFGGHLYGKANLTGTYDAHGWEPEAFMNSLTMNGRGDIRDGKMVTSGALFKMLSSLAEKTGQSFEKEQPIKGLSSNIKVADGRVGLDQLASSLGTLGDIRISGSYGFDGTLDYAGELELSRTTTEKLLAKGGFLGGMASLFKDKKSERVVLPLKISGSASAPKADFDYSVLSKKAGENLKEEAGNLLKGLFKKK